MSIEFSIITILAIHLFADFVFQTRQMGKKKSSSLKWLTYHILVYTTITCLGWISFLGLNVNQLEPCLNLIIITFITHFVTDFFTSKLSGYFYVKMVKEKSAGDELAKKGNPGYNEAQYNAYFFGVDRRKESRFEWLFWLTVGTDQLLHSITLIMTYKFLF